MSLGGYLRSGKYGRKFLSIVVPVYMLLSPMDVCRKNYDPPKFAAPEPNHYYDVQIRKFHEQLDEALEYQTAIGRLPNPTRPSDTRILCPSKED